MRAAYSLSYRLGLTSWDKTGADADAAFGRMLDREEVDRMHPSGAPSTSAAAPAATRASCRAAAGTPPASTTSATPSTSP